MKITIHQTHHSVADFDSIFDYLKQNITQNSTGIHVFPELFLTGYPLQDLCLQRPFIYRYEKFINALSTWLKSEFTKPQFCLLMGGLDYELTELGNPNRIRNVIYEFSKNHSFTSIYRKQLLPNYDIFDEKKYFTAGDTPYILNFNDKNYGLLICEDMWTSSQHSSDPVKELKAFADEKQTKIDAVINLSGSPYLLEKSAKRLKRAGYISHLFQCPYVYVNRVGAEDEVIFDGQSFIIDGDDILVKGKKFKEDILVYEGFKPENYNEVSITEQENTWQELFQSRLDRSFTPPKLLAFNDQEAQEGSHDRNSIFASRTRD